MDYNTQREKIILPEYGRLVQNMVERALTLDDRQQRQHLAEAIVDVMGNLFPQNKNVPDFKHKLWDHLALISGYRLDIDYPYGKPEPKPADAHPARVPYPNRRIRYRHYGKLLESFIDYLSQLPEGEEKERLATLVAGRMKRSLAEWNKDSLSNEKIADDLARYTDGRVQIDPAALKTTGNHTGRQTGRNRIKRIRRPY